MVRKQVVTESIVTQDLPTPHQGSDCGNYELSTHLLFVRTGTRSLFQRTSRIITSCSVRCGKPALVFVQPRIRANRIFAITRFNVPGAIVQPSTSTFHSTKSTTARGRRLGGHYHYYLPLPVRKRHTGTSIMRLLVALPLTGIRL
jgi:hypothetical protein